MCFLSIPTFLTLTLPILVTLDMIYGPLSDERGLHSWFHAAHRSLCKHCIKCSCNLLSQLLQNFTLFCMVCIFHDSCSTLDFQVFAKIHYSPMSLLSLLLLAKSFSSLRVCFDLWIVPYHVVWLLLLHICFILHHIYAIYSIKALFLDHSPPIFKLAFGCWNLKVTNKVL